MNEKFFDLKKEKQDRMINAALKIFAKNGYRHASTDDIVVEAGISKGLLFHYFGSKLGLYTFLYDYCTKVIGLEFKASIPSSEKDYFKIMLAMENAKHSVLKTYPYMYMFIDNSESDDATEAINETADIRVEFTETIDNILSNVDTTAFKDFIDPEALNNMLTYALRGCMQEYLHAPLFNADAYHAEAVKLINMVSDMSV